MASTPNEKVMPYLLGTKVLPVIEYLYATLPICTIPRRTLLMVQKAFQKASTVQSCTTTAFNKLEHGFQKGI